ncbi:MAG: hypothetical protein DHS20C16_26870 [Phycisphaerae bacterium]|nr:MAG: hypothetical protein DHS20C16_26870 [Phycisphaerae bacterium]
MQLKFQNQTVVLLFAKYPTAGAVMTRLCPPLSPADAARVQHSCMRHIWRELTHGDWCRPVLVGAPDDSLTDFAAILDSATSGDSSNVCWPQGDGDLGERLERASKRAFDDGAKEVVFLGVDSPMQDWEAIRQLPKRLTNVDVAVGPCADGGYYFLATRRHIPELFKGIDWGTSRVFEQTCAIAEQLGLSIWQAALGYDIDRIEDLRNALGDFDPNCELANTIRDILVTANVSEKDTA